MKNKVNPIFLEELEKVLDQIKNQAENMNFNDLEELKSFRDKTKYYTPVNKFKNY
jgi:hypothetical protein